MEIVHKAKATTYAGSAWHQELDFPEPANFGMTITSADSLPLLVYFMSESDFLEITGSGEISEEIMKNIEAQTVCEGSDLQDLWTRRFETGKYFICVEPDTNVIPELQKVEFEIELFID